MPEISHTPESILDCIKDKESENSHPLCLALALQEALLSLEYSVFKDKIFLALLRSSFCLALSSSCAFFL